MIYLYYATSIFGTVYFLASKRVPDGFLLAFFSALIYFLPGYFGYVAEPYPPNHREIVQIEAEVYLIFLSVLWLIVFSGIVSDRLGRTIAPLPRFHGERGRFSNYLVLGILLVLFFVTLQDYDESIFSDDKHLMMNDLPYTHKFLVLYAVLAGLLFLFKRQYWFLAFCLVIIAWDVYVGFRSRAAFFFVSAFLIYAHGLGPVRLIKKWRIGLSVVAAGWFFFFYKSVYQSVKRGDYSSAIDRFLSIENVASSVVRSEPFTIQATLNRIVRESYSLPYNVLTDQVAAVFPLSRTVGLSSVEKFNDHFQPDLFPDLSFGMAANWWALWFSALGFLGVILGAFVVVLGCLAVNFFLRSHSLFLSTFGGALASVWLFYIHRNDILFTFGHVMQMAFMVLMTIALVLFLACFSDGRLSAAKSISVVR